MRTPAVYAAAALSPIASVSRSSAWLARIVRAPEMARSTVEVISPIRSWACADAARTRRDTVSATVSPASTPASGDAEQQRVQEQHGDGGAEHHDRTGGDLEQSGGDHRPQQRGVRADPGQQVTGAPPVVLAIGSRSRWPTSRRRAVSTRPSAVRCSR